MHHVGLECNFLKWTPCACLESLAGRQEAGTDVVERCLCLPFGDGDPSSDPDEARDEVGLSGLTPSTEARRARCLRVSLATATAAPTAPVARSASLRRMRGRGQQRIGASFAFARQYWVSIAQPSDLESDALPLRHRAIGSTGSV